MSKGLALQSKNESSNTSHLLYFDQRRPTNSNTPARSIKP